MSQMIVRVAIVAVSVGWVVAVIGCAGRPSLVPNRDPSLRKTSAQFAADAAKRFPYKEDAPQAGEAVARAEVRYAGKYLDVVNLSKEDWNDVEIWVNQKYVVFLPTMKAMDLKALPFEMIYDEQGNYFPTDNVKHMVNRVQAYRDGKMYDIKVALE